MSLYYSDDMVTLHHGDALTVARELEPGSVQTIVTSPPYYGLRDYGVDGQLGMEASVQEYVDRLVAVFGALREVLADDGTLWLNLGDSYATDAGEGRGKNSAFLNRRVESHQRRGASKTVVGLHRKNLLGVPWRVAFALQADGWILRSDIIWAKPNPMPESVTDRPTKAHEYLFLFAKSPRYYYDAKAIAEPVAPSTTARLSQVGLAAQAGSDRGNGGAKTNGAMKAVGPRFGGTKYGDDDSKESRTKSGNEYIGSGRANKRTVWTIPTIPFSAAHFAVYPPELIRSCILAGSRPAGRRCDCHELIRTPVGTGERGPDASKRIGRAGMNRPRRATEGSRPMTRREQRSHAEQIKLSPHRAEIEALCGPGFAHYIRTDRSGARPLPPDVLETLRERGWITDPPSCTHLIEPADVVLDPFSGSGTTGMVATQEGRRYVGIDLNADYLRLSLETRFAQPVLNLEALA